MTRLILIVAAMMSVFACSSTPVSQVNTALTCDCKADSELIRSISAVILDNGFVKDEVRPLHSWPGTTMIARFNQNKPSSLIVILYDNVQKGFGVVIGDQSTAGPFSPQYIDIVDKLELNIAKAFPNKFKECHEDFDRGIMHCAIGGHLSDNSQH